MSIYTSTESAPAALEWWCTHARPPQVSYWCLYRPLEVQQLRGVELRTRRAVRNRHDNTLPLALLLQLDGPEWRGSVTEQGVITQDTKLSE